MKFTSFKLVLTSLLCAALTACGGGYSPGDSEVLLQPHPVATGAGTLTDVAVPTPRQAAARTPDATSFLNWAESAYPNYFPPPQSNKTLEVWTYRYYPQTDIYLGTNTSGDVLGLVGTGGGAYNAVPLGKIADFACSVYPSDCETTNVAPIANAGVAQNVVVGNVVTLDGSASSDANSDPLTYAWALTSKPAGSTATLSSSTLAKPTFTADVAGMYVVSLVVNDGKLTSTSVSNTVTSVARISGALGISYADNYRDFCGISGKLTTVSSGGTGTWSFSNCSVFGTAGSPLLARLQNNGSTALTLTQIHILAGNFGKAWSISPSSQTINPGSTVDFALPLWLSLEVTNAVATFSLIGEPNLVVQLKGSMTLP